MSYVSSKSLKDSGSSVYVERFIDGVDYTSGTTTTLTTSEPMPAANSVWVYFDGVVQHHSEYGVSGYSIIFTSAIPTATDNVEIQFNKLVSVGVAGENTVTNSMMTADNISTLLRKNVIINGDHDIWQRGTSQTLDGRLSNDRWYNEHFGSTKTHSQQTFTLGQTDVPNNPTYYSRTAITTSVGASNYTLTWQKIENVNTFAGETITLSFWAKADATKNMAVEFTQEFGTGGTPSTRVTGIGVTTIGLTTAWQKHTVTASVPSISGKTLGTDNNDGFLLAMWFEAGTTFDARTNSLGNQSGTFDIAQVQIEKGDTATDFERRSYGEELALCKRYFERLDSTDSIHTRFGSGHKATTSQAHSFIRYTEKRAVPTITDSGFADFAFYHNNVVTSVTSISWNSMTTKTADTITNMTATGAVGDAGMFLSDGVLTAWIDIDAEL